MRNFRKSEKSNFISYTVKFYMYEKIAQKALVDDYVCSCRMNAMLLRHMMFSFGHVVKSGSFWR